MVFFFCCFYLGVTIEMIYLWSRRNASMSSSRIDLNWDLNQHGYYTYDSRSHAFQRDPLLPRPWTRPRSSVVEPKLILKLSQLEFTIRNMEECCICLVEDIKEKEYVVCSKCHNSIHRSCWKKIPDTFSSKLHCCYCRSNSLVFITTIDDKPASQLVI